MHLSSEFAVNTAGYLKTSIVTSDKAASMAVLIPASTRAFSFLCFDIVPKQAGMHFILFFVTGNLMNIPACRGGACDALRVPPLKYKIPTVRTKRNAFHVNSDRALS